MSWITFPKLMENVNTIAQMVANYPIDLQEDIKRHYHFGDEFHVFLASLPWTPTIVQEFGMPDARSVLRDSADIAVLYRYRFFRYESDAALWRLSS